MINLRNQSVNVNRLELIEALKTGRELHRKEFQEALTDYKQAVEVYLEKALERVKNNDFEDVVLRLHPPTNHEEEYTDVIDLLGVSVDQIINLDSEAYKAYYKNEWSWSKQLKSLSATYKSAIGSIG